MELSAHEISEIQKHWPLTEITFHRYMANVVYFAKLDGREVVLRLTYPNHRKAEEVESELAFMDYLSSHGMKIAAPIKNFAGQFLAIFPQYMAAVYEKAYGTHLDLTKVTHEQMQIWGEYIGKMHRLTKLYQPDIKLKPRSQWYDDENIVFAMRTHHPEDGILYHRFNEFMSWLKTLPQSPRDYGLIHCDLHSGNFFMEGDQITAFDFDDTCYHWFAYDLTPPLYSLEKYPEALDELMKGYQKENSLDPIWIKRIPIFFKFRKCLLYYYLKTSMAEGRLSQKYIDWTKENFPKIIKDLEPEIHYF